MTWDILDPWSLVLGGKLPLTLWKVNTSNCPLNIVYTHRPVLPSALVTEASLCSDWHWMQRLLMGQRDEENELLLMLDPPRDI